MKEVIDFFKDLPKSIPTIQSVVFGSEDDLKNQAGDSLAYPCLFASGLQRKFEGDPDEALFAVYEIQIEILAPNEKGNYEGRQNVWQETEKIMDSIFRKCAEEYKLDWEVFRMEWFAGFTANNLAGVSSVIPIKIAFFPCS